MTPASQVVSSPDASKTLDAKDFWLALGIGLVVGVLHRLIGGAAGADGTFIKYGIAAQQHIHGNLPAIRQMDLSPLYFEANVWLQQLIPGPGMALGPLAWIQRSAVAASAALLYLIAGTRMSRGWALLCAMAFAFEPHVMVYEYVYEPEVLLVFFLLACVFAAERWGAIGSMLAGVFAACAIASRPTFLLLFLVLGPLYSLLNGERGRRLALRSAAFIVPIVLCGVILGLRAERVTGDASTPVMNPGTVFFEGTHPLSRGTSAAYPPIVASMIVVESGSPDEAHSHYRDVARLELKRNVSIAEANAFWAGKAIAFLADEPGRAFERYLEKATRIFREYRWHDLGTADELEVRLPNVPGFFAALSALALLGILFELPRLNSNLYFYSYFAVQFVVMLVFYVSARQQMVLIAPLVFFATVALRAVATSRTRAIWGVLFFVPTLVFLLGSSDAVKDNIHRTAGNIRAEEIATTVRSLGESESIAAHADLVAEIIASSPWLLRESVPGNVGQEPDSVALAAAKVLRNRSGRSFFDEFDLATLELEAGALADARARFEQLAQTGRLPYRSYLQPSDPLFYLGRIAALQGNETEAITFLERALANTPGDPYVLAEICVLSGSHDARAQLERYFSTLDAQLLLGEAYLAHGRATDAIRELTALTKLLPGLHRALVPLAVAHGIAGDVDAGMAVYQKSLRLRSIPVIWSAGTSDLIRGWATAHASELEVQLEAARLLYFHGRFQEAMRLLVNLEAVPDGDLRVREMIEKIRDTLAVVPKAA